MTRAHVASLLELLDDRLALMPQVARYKYANDLPISAPERERDLLAALTVEASAHGLDGALVCSLFRAQIEVSKQIQRKRIDAWKARGAARTADGPELGSEIRPRIDEIGRQVLVELDALQDVPPCETACAAAALAATYLTQPDLSAAWRKAVVAPLGRVGAQCGRSPSARSRSPRAGLR